MKRPRTKPDRRLEQSTWEYNLILVCSCPVLRGKLEQERFPEPDTDAGGKREECTDSHEEL